MSAAAWVLLAFLICDALILLALWLESRGERDLSFDEYCDATDRELRYLERRQP